MERSHDLDVCFWLALFNTVSVLIYLNLLSLFINGVGKTSWARSLGKHCSLAINFSLRVCHLPYYFERYNALLYEWQDDVEYLILDEAHWRDICPIAKSILIAPGKSF